MKIPAQQNGNPLAACYCSQLEKALSEVNYAKPLKRQFLSQMQDLILCQEKVQIKNDFFPSCQHT